jgi:hypothetical protein
MPRASPAGRRVRILVPMALAIVVALLGSLVAVVPTAHPVAVEIPFIGDSSTPVAIATFSLDPSSVSAGSSTTVSVSLSGGTAPYDLWFNSTIPNCGPPSTPVSSGGPQYEFSCQPSSQGGYSIHLDVVDSSVPSTRASAVADLAVVSSNSGNNGGNNSNGNNNGNGSGGGGSLALPSGLEELVLIIGLVFVGAMIAIAAGTIATAAIVSRRLRQINETLAKMNLPPKEPKPPA